MLLTGTFSHNLLGRRQIASRALGSFPSPIPLLLPCHQERKRKEGRRKKQRKGKTERERKKEKKRRKKERQKKKRQSKVSI